MGSFRCKPGDCSSSRCCKTPFADTAVVQCQGSKWVRPWVRPRYDCVKLYTRPDTHALMSDAAASSYMRDVVAFVVVLAISIVEVWVVRHPHGGGGGGGGGAATLARAFRKRTAKLNPESSDTSATARAEEGLDLSEGWGVPV